jgi:Iap family predicted aminopeptidase
MADDTDDDLCSGKRSRERKTIDNHASVILLDIINEQWEAVADKKVARSTLFTAIARELRARGIKISLKTEKIWGKVYDRWNKMKVSYKSH